MQSSIHRSMNDDSSKCSVPDQPVHLSSTSCIVEQQRKTIAKLEKNFSKIERNNKRKQHRKVHELSATAKQYIGTEFSTYKHLKRKDIALIQQIEQKQSQEKLQTAFEQEQAEKNRILAQKTEKNRKKRQKRNKKDTCNYLLLLRHCLNDRLPFPFILVTLLQLDSVSLIVECIFFWVNLPSMRIVGTGIIKI